ncbi:MAG: bifunctional 5,10-methylenetetrahydrofolate dehydrogenase/5,10-methenyltetrahydrofolate cyclohydrolase [Spirochaetales bacterium]|nr:bifunctional 5,10-methylenetetrahydrofolate dehydrogenase/5,10-methenyltetrahydrofolate cyclohydrolase [Spirochaetales bacterium]
MVLMSGVQPASVIRQSCTKRSGEYEKSYGRRPALAVVLVGDNPSSRSYVRTKRRACEQVGIDHRDFFLDSSISQEALLELVAGLNADDSVDGILVQLPLPPGIDERLVIDSIDPAKDVDGFTPVNMGNLLIGNPCLAPCTPAGILEMIDYYSIRTEGKSICIIGRSNIVGKPLAAMLMQRNRNATVTVCHSQTPDLRRHTLNADIIISAVGHPSLVDADMVSPGAVVIDVGITRVEDPAAEKGFRWVGDCDFDALSLKCSAITPVPGGVGPMTIAMLMSNTVKAAFARRAE